MNNLSSLEIIKVSGNDSVEFLQGQLTNDIRMLDANNFIYACQLNNKGRILATYIIIKINENEYFLITTKSVINSVFQKLKLYILRSKVSLEIIPNNIIYLSFSDIIISNSIKSINIGNKYLVLSYDKLAEDNEFNWTLFLINNKIPFIYKETEMLLIPNEIGYDNINGISYNKGCYIGQEIVARIHYLGKSKQDIFKIKTNDYLNKGMSIYSPLLVNQQIGLVIECLKINNEYLGLACINKSYINELYLDKQFTQKIILL